VVFTIFFEGFIAVRLIKYLTLSVDLSRNQGKFFIQKGRVSVDGKVETNPDFKLPDSAEVCFDGNRVTIIPHQYILLNKPALYSCTTQKKIQNSVFELIGILKEEKNYYFAKALGVELTGLVLISDDVRWASRIRSRLEKKKFIYVAKFSRTISISETEELQKILSNSSNNKSGSIINFKKFDETTLVITLSNIKASDLINRLSSHGFIIENLHLQQVGRLDLGNLKEGNYLEITENIKI